MRIIDINEYKDIVSKNTSAILCGNGLSMNFDTGYCSIFDKYYESNKEIYGIHKYSVIGRDDFKGALKNNFRAVMKQLKDLDRDGYYKIFDDAYLFASSIVCNKQLCEYLFENKVVSNLVFGISQIDLVQSIHNAYKNKGPAYVNIEHWTILVFFYYALRDIDKSIYQFPTNNSFIDIIRIGDSNNHLFDIKKDNNINSLINGFLIYYRFLVAYTVFNNGKSVTCKNLDKIDSLDIASIKEFFSFFDMVLTTNYDHIIEGVIDREAIHIHGSYVVNQNEYVFSQNLSISYNYKEYGFSDMTIGDYFLFKTFLPVVNNLAKGKNKIIHSLSEQFADLFMNKKVNTVSLFGLNIDNDQHIIRNLLLELYNAKVEKPQIIYCYFVDKERDDFESNFWKVITFREDVNEYCRDIELIYVKTQDILNDFF